MDRPRPSRIVVLRRVAIRTDMRPVSLRKRRMMPGRGAGEGNLATCEPTRPDAVLRIESAEGQLAVHAPFERQVEPRFKRTRQVGRPLKPLDAALNRDAAPGSVREEVPPRAGYRRQWSGRGAAPFPIPRQAPTGTRRRSRPTGQDRRSRDIGARGASCRTGREIFRPRTSRSSSGRTIRRSGTPAVRRASRIGGGEESVQGSARAPLRIGG